MCALLNPEHVGYNMSSLPLIVIVGTSLEK